MRLTAKLKSKDNFLVFEPFGNTERLKCEKVYEIKEYKSNRSNEQNRLMWAIIQSIAQETGQPIMDVYIEGLEFCDAKHIFMESVPEAENELKKAFRAVKIMESRTNINNKQTVVYKCYFGSSKFDSKEMTKLINYFQDLARDLNIRLEEQC